MTGSSYESVVIEADGGSRGNPGPAAFGAVLKEAVTGAVIAEVSETIGTATNNVAEYRGLIAGLELALEFAPGASVEVRMDSKLVVEQMSGTWKIKHPSMRPLAAQASTLAPAGTVYTWIPRAENSHADRLVNEALDQKPVTPPRPAVSRGWLPPTAPPTTLILVRHGVTDHTADKLFSGGLGGSNPALNEEGRAQIRATGEWLAPLAESVDALITSPVRRTYESAEILASLLDQPVTTEPGIAEMEFGAWDGLSFAQVQERFGDELALWLGAMDYAPPGGESFEDVAARVIQGRDRIIAAHTGHTVVVVSHVTPIKTLVADALGAPLKALYKMELAAASVTVISYFRGGQGGDELLASLRLFNARPTETGFAV
ncbi:MAG: pspA 3 [Marmoricola sp.]|nr:pspA 3 [Marmoricola sp.]